MANERYPYGILDVWGGGQLLAFSGVDGPTPFHQALAARTSFAGTGLLIKYPDEAGLVFDPGPPGALFLTADLFDLVHAGGRTRGAFLDACHLLVEGPCRVESLGLGLQVARQGQRTLVGAAAQFRPDKIESDLDQAIEDRLGWIRSAQERVFGARARAMGSLQRKTLWKCLSVLKSCVYSPEGVIGHRYTTPDRWPHRGMWLWDSAFNAIGLRHMDPALARDAVEAVLDAQHPDGMVQISYHHTDEPASYTQPPTLAMAADCINRTEPDRPWIERIYPKLASYLEWDMTNRDSDGDGLLEWEIEAGAECRCGKSGWDNSPRFDAARRLNAVDFNSFMARECEVMAGFARLLGKAGDEETWRAHHRRICGLINRKLWNEDLGLYVDAFAGSAPSGSAEQQPMLTAAGFLPLLCGAPSRGRAAAMAAHLRDPGTFATAVPVATVSPREEERYSKDMWRGPMWVNVNWLIATGLERYGHTEEAALLRERTCSTIEKYCERYGVIFEFFDSQDELPPPELLRKRKNDPAEWIHQVIHDYSWTAAVYLDFRTAQ